MPRLAPRMSRIVGSATIAMNNLVAQKKAAGIDVISFSVGEPDFETPPHISQAAKEALDAGKTKYTPGPGIPELRRAIAGTAQEEQRIPCEAKNILVAPAKQAVLYSLLATVDHGDDVLLPDPAWVSYEPMVRWAHANPVPVPLEPDQGFRMTPEAVAQRITPRSKAIVLNSPSNPTGGINTAADVRGIVELAIDHDLWIISDEIYRHLQYEGEALSPAALPGGFERTITVDGLSKSFAMTGWRMGWAIAPNPAWGALDRLQSHSLTHITSFAQYGALAALQGPQDSVAAMKAEFRARRDLIVAGLRALPGVTCPEPMGAFYVFPSFDKAKWGGLRDEDLALALLDQANIAVTAGTSFGSRGQGHLRFSYATGQERIRTGLERLAAWQASR
ncbi:MAG TPA: pyridoxal phosphate-dependent aminotransferase [Candidatus Thermoplasmatota archaeon]|nr:pyridoxal phosphate-dependent aminotransferase [Candidatus Thermoplasmatota archaeon]